MVRPRLAKSVRSPGRAIRMTSVLCSSPSAPTLTSLTIQATSSLPQRENRPENTASRSRTPNLETCPEDTEAGDAHLLPGLQGGDDAVHDGPDCPGGRGPGQAGGRGDSLDQTSVVHRGP